MAIAFDAASEAGEFTAATDPKTWTHTPSGTPRGVLVFAQNPGTTADWINGTVSYGGVAMTRVATNGWAVDSAVEVASIYAYFLGSGIPSGAQTVSIDHNNGIFGTKWACCITLTGAADTEVVASGKVTADTANPSITLDSGSRTAVKSFNLYSGKDAIASITNDSGITRLYAAKYASENRCRVVGYRTTPGTGSETVSQTATSDDVAMIGVAVAEVAANVTVTPSTASLVTATFAPTVTASDHKTATPSTASLTLTTFAPTVAVTDHKTVTPDTAALTLATFAPTVTATGNATVTPDPASLALTAFAPSVVITDHKVVTPGAASLSLTAFAPNVTASDHKLVTPTTASLALTGYAPTVTASDHKVVTPGAASLSLTGYAPTVVASGQAGSVTVVDAAYGSVSLGVALAGSATAGDAAYGSVALGVSLVDSASTSVTSVGSVEVS